MAEKKCNHCGNDNDSFAMELLKGYKKQFYVTVAVLSAIILLLTGYIIYDVYIDKNNTSKKLLIYNAFKNGILSWFGIMVIIIFAFIMLLVKIDEKISNKLK